MANDLEKLYEQRNGRKFNEKASEEDPKQNEAIQPITYTIAQIASMLTVSKATARKIIKTENIPTVPCTKNIIVMKAAFDQWVEARNNLYS